MNRNSLSFRIIRSVLIICTLLFLVSFGVYSFFARRIIQNTTRENAIFLAENTARKISEILLPEEKIPGNAAWMLSDGAIPKDSLLTFLTAIVRENPNLYGSVIAYEPNFFPDQGLYFAPFAARNGNTITTTLLGNENYEYFYMDWYQIPKMTGKPYWSEPYYDEGGGNVLMSTCSYPFYTTQNGNRKFAGVVAVHLSLEWLTDVVSSVKILESGYAYLLSRNGYYVTHPNTDYIMNQSIFSVAKELNEPELRALGREMIAGESRFVSLHLKSWGKVGTYYTPLPFSGWTLGVVFPEREMYASLKAITLLLAVLLLAGLLLLTLFTVNAIRNQLSPLKRFAASARQIAKGDFFTPLPRITTHDEMQELHASFGYMQQKLSEYIENLQHTTAAKEKIESELRIASEIQMSMIPNTFPPFPDLPQIDLFGVLHPAREVGGDLFDFFLIDKKQFCFAIGDVSGKGVPASLFMAVTRTLLRSVADRESSTARIVDTMNRSLTEGNESNMFVTFFLGILDLESGLLRYTNAGHNPPAIRRNNEEVTFFGHTGCIPVGLFNTAAYNESEISLARGDKLFLFTDGVTEAEDALGMQYGEERLLTQLKAHGHEDPRTLTAHMEKDIAIHVKGNPPSDDITMLTLYFHE